MRRLGRFIRDLLLLVFCLVVIAVLILVIGYGLTGGIEVVLNVFNE